MLVRLWIKGSQLSQDLLPLAKACVLLLPHMPIPTDPQKRPKGWPELCATFPLTPVEGMGLLVPQQGGCGEYRTVAVQLSHTKGYDHRDVDESSPQTLLL